jgi:hypothetical protein
MAQAEFYDEVVLTGLDYFPGYKFSRLFFQPNDGNGKPFNEIANKYLIYGNQPWPHDASTCSDPSHHHDQHQQEEDPMEQSRVEVTQPHLLLFAIVLTVVFAAVCRLLLLCRSLELKKQLLFLSLSAIKEANRFLSPSFAAPAAAVASLTLSSSSLCCPSPPSPSPLCDLIRKL